MRQAALDYLDDEVFYAVLIDLIHRDLGEILAAGPRGVLVRTDQGVGLISARDADSATAMLDILAPKNCHTFVVFDEEILSVVEAKFGCGQRTPVHAAIYRGDPIPEIQRPELKIETLGEQWAGFVVDHYGMDDADYVRSRVEAGEIWGLFRGEEILGFIGLHVQGAMGLLEILPDHRRQGYAEYLLTYLTNRLLGEGRLPHDHIIVGNEASVRLQEKLGFEITERTAWWVGS